MKKVFRSSSLLLFFVFFFVSASAQKNNWPNTLLWKISGNGLTKPSYLFGTMHLQDKRIFNLGDSFYHHFGLVITSSRVKAVISQKSSQKRFAKTL